MQTKEKLLILIGPTAVGKTKLSIEIAKKYNCEIISGDSMQVYRGMDIGTAKISHEEMEGIPHHLIDIKEPNETFSVAEFQQIVREKISEIHARNRVPLIVGGTGLYIQSVIYDYQFTEESPDIRIRKQLEAEAEQSGVEELYQRLKTIDPETANKIHPNNVRRVIRALEVYYTTGKTMTEVTSTQKRELLYDCYIIGLEMEREKLYQRINQRVDQMIADGLLEEARAFYDQGIKGTQSTQAIGYKELFDYFEGHVTLDEAIAQLKQNTRRYAKRQLTWFRNKMDVDWFDVTHGSDLKKIFEKISLFLAGKLDLKANT